MTAATPPSAVPVLLVVRELGLGGIERDVTKLALGFDRSRYLPFVASYKPEGPRFEELQAAGIPVLHLRISSLLSLSSVKAAVQLTRFVRRHRIRIVHSFDPSSVFVNPVARLIGVPVVLSSQLGHRDLHDPRTRQLLRRTERFSDTIVVNCEALRQHMITQHNVPPERLELCYNGVETAVFYPGPGDLPAAVADAPFVIGAISVLRPEKALHELQQAFAKVRGLLPGLKLLIVGSGPELARLEQTRVDLDLADDCVLVPARKDVAPLMRGLQVFVSCSHSEAFSNAILEAMACGCAVVGSRVGGTPELLGEDERGLLFEAGNVADLARTIARLMQDERLRLTLSQRAAEYARVNLNIEKNIQRTMQIYDTLLERKGLTH